MTLTVMRIKFEKVYHLNFQWTVLVFPRTFEYDLEMFLSIYLSVLDRFDPPKKKHCKKKVFGKPISETKIWYQ